ncbi:hypothetical protein ACJRO7_034799 [Eucalyptus globulus]|uniref:Uncharacterized protein n=1 Tax=Eucalyptus globulus TaxID=34317 RepID=A0ABD3J8Q8_EUCGL
MSGVIDKWTRKLREKGQAIFSAGSANSAGEAGQAETGSSGWLSPVFSRAKQVGSPSLLCSEASVGMLVECFSP